MGQDQYMHNRGTDRLLADLARTPEPTREQVRRAVSQARAIAQELADRARKQCAGVK